uniref:DUF7358 domain-containing protein n=2 Tax=Opuntia streptacantha TaxID=393608 RepID=A0A7C8ZPT0_OPUST
MRGSLKKVVKNLRCSSIVLGVTNVGVMALGGTLIAFSPRMYCSGHQLIPFCAIMATAGVRILAMVRCAIHQQAAAIAILGSSPHDPVASNDLSRLQRRLRYKRWLCWTRLASAVTVMQFLLAVWLLFMVVKMSNGCIIGLLTSNQLWKQNLLIVFLIVVCFVAILQCFSSADILKWRSFYETQDHAWKAHYEEVFDHGIREAFCCLGRAKYLGIMENDEVYSVAQLLGDLVTYRASGAGHLELLAGLALLQRHNQYPKLDECSVDAPDDEIQEATSFHPFAEATYTGPLLDVGRNPILFPCTWLYRQGILTAWCRNRRPVLQGDNWWRGHAAAFIKYANIPPESLRRGRVNQGKCQAAYFVVVLHHIRSVVIAIRGTETPEDLITDGLCRETSLTMEDLDGLINGTLVDPMMRQSVLLSSPHYGHSGIVEAARELYKQIAGSNSGPLSCLTRDSSPCSRIKIKK